MAFWVHFCELPMNLYNLSMAERLGNAIGSFKEYDSGSRGYGCTRVFVFVFVFVGLEFLAGAN